MDRKRDKAKAIRADAPVAHLQPRLAPTEARGLACARRSSRQVRANRQRAAGPASLRRHPPALFGQGRPCDHRHRGEHALGGRSARGLGRLAEAAALPRVPQTRARQHRRRLQPAERPVGARRTHPAHGRAHRRDERPCAARLDSGRRRDARPSAHGQRVRRSLPLPGGARRQVPVAAPVYGAGRSRGAGPRRQGVRHRQGHLRARLLRVDSPVRGRQRPHRPPAGAGDPARGPACRNPSATC